jgi:hypothetical protein
MMYDTCDDIYNKMKTSSLTNEYTYRKYREIGTEVDAVVIVTNFMFEIPIVVLIFI